MVAVDDCGVRINPMIVEGQIHGGLAEGYAMAAMEQITFDEEGNCIGANFTDYLIPTAWETPKFELGETVTPSPTTDRREGRRRVRDRRLARRVRERGDRRAVAPRRPEHRHAAHEREGVGGDPGSEGDRVAWSHATRGPGARERSDAPRRAVRARDGRVAARAVLGKEGSTALVTPDRRVRGWLGGACAEPTVIREALKALEEGTPRLLFLGPPEELAARGARRHRSDRLSE